MTEPSREARLNVEAISTHANAGQCPDGLEGWDSRDPDCPACIALDALDALVATGSLAVLDLLDRVAEAAQPQPGDGENRLRNRILGVIEAERLAAAQHPAIAPALLESP